MNNQQLEDLLKLQKSSFRQFPPDYKKRMDALKKLSQIVDEYTEQLTEAISKDFGLRAREETMLLEIFPLHDEIKHAMKNLRIWMKKQRVQSAWFLLPSTAYFQFQPLGSVGIMGAWNYQILLTLSPLVDAIAAGNHVVLKPSEIAPASAEVIMNMINTSFEKEYIHCITGDAELAKSFSSLAFDHLFFTGSTRIGKLIMASAAPNLTPVTIELGGKSPAIIHKSFDLLLATKRILAGKLLNAGQTCVATDYVILPKELNDEFLTKAKDCVAEFYPDILNNEQYSHIINKRQFERLNDLLEDAKNKGARVVEVSDSPNKSPQLMTPKLVFDVTEEMAIMREEIFGPILPILNLHSVEAAIDYVNDHNKPLALYYFDTSKKRIRHLLRYTLSGGVTINDTIYHLAQHNLPFGGVGASGMGHYHGFDGFRTFSKKRGVMHQKKYAATDILHPPYTGFKKKLVSIMGKLSKA